MNNGLVKTIIGDHELSIPERLMPAEPVKNKKQQRADSFEEMRVLHRTTAYAIKVGDQYFAGFGGGLGGSPIITKFKHGLCEAKLIGGSNRTKVKDYLKKLADRGYVGTVHLVSIGGVA